MIGGDSLNNKYRVLLTEVLPYELPIMLNNEAFYQNMLDDGTRKVFENVFENVFKHVPMYQEWSIPFDYSIRRMGGEKSRRLSLIHPLTQLGCFYHIYTHSVAWAIKGKEFAKEHSGKQTFEEDFDSLMRHVNYNETNGIVVGPEMSRIFAEVILQRVDIDVLERLKAQGLTLGKDYEVRRYVDDSYVYANSKDILDKIRQTFADELSKYKLDINMNKLEYASRPFGSDINDAKDDLRQLLEEFRSTYLKKGDDGKYTRSISNEMKVFSRVANGFRTTTHKYGLTYGTLNKYFLALLLRQIRSEKKTEAYPSTGLLLAYVEIAMYVFSLDMHTTASYRLCSIVQELSGWADSLTECNCKQELQSKVCRELKRVLDIYTKIRIQRPIQI